VVRAGYSANANIVLDHRDKVLTINESMLIFDKEHRFVEVQISPQQFEKREVKLGLSDGIRAEVLSGVEEKDLLRKPVRAVATEPRFDQSVVACCAVPARGGGDLLTIQMPTCASCLRRQLVDQSTNVITLRRMVTLDRALPVAPVVDPVQAVRRFNRFYTRQIGVLQEHLLESQFSLTEVRVLYELSHRGSVTAVDLREVLGLDRGYLSRMLQKFEERGWIKAIPSPADRRRLFLSLTSKGEKIFAPLDRRSSEEVAAMLAKLPSPRQTALVRGMREIESILHPSRPGEPTFILRRHRSGDMGWVVHRHGVIYAKEYGYDECFEALVAEIVAGFIKNFDAKRERCWIAERDGEVVGSIFLVKKSRTVAKLRFAPGGTERARVGNRRQVDLGMRQVRAPGRIYQDRPVDAE